MMNCCLLVKDRPRLTRQALETFVANTDVPWTMCIVDDASGPETASMLRIFAKGHSGKVALLRNETSSGITAQARNLGVYWSERRFGRGHWLCLLDNDCYFTPGWASKMIQAWPPAGYQLIGGQNHPYHKHSGGIVMGESHEVRVYLAVAGTCWTLPWPVWDKYGPLVETGAPGVGQSEDAAFCNKIREAGGKVGAIWPQVVIHTGVTNSDGKPAIGMADAPRVEGVLYL